MSASRQSVLVAALLAAAACAPELRDGQFLCVSGPCPADFECCSGVCQRVCGAEDAGTIDGGRIDRDAGRIDGGRRDGGSESDGGTERDAMPSGCADCVDGQTCDLLTDTCSSTPPGSVNVCLPCTNDLQCYSGYACVELQYAGASYGHHCVPLDTPGTCVPPYRTRVTRPSLSATGVALAVCVPNPSHADCAAILTYGTPCDTATMCPSAASECNSMQCTYSCDSSYDCPAEAECVVSGSTYCDTLP